MVHTNGGTSIVMQCSPLYAIFTIHGFLVSVRSEMPRNLKLWNSGEGQICN